MLIRPLSHAVFLLLGACAHPQVSTAEKTPAVRVEYLHPEKFSDVGNRRSSSDQVRADYLEQLARHLAGRAAALLPEGDKLSVSITEVDMAGDFEPWRWGEIRVVRDIYPPRIDLSFSLAGSDGRLIKRGERALRDPAFLETASGYRDDPLRYEKLLIDHWLGEELSREQLVQQPGDAIREHGRHN